MSVSAGIKINFIFYDVLYNNLIEAVVLIMLCAIKMISIKASVVISQWDGIVASTPSVTWPLISQTLVVDMHQKQSSCKNSPPKKSSPCQVQKVLISKNSAKHTHMCVCVWHYLLYVWMCVLIL